MEVGIISILGSCANASEVLCLASLLIKALEETHKSDTAYFHFWTGVHYIGKALFLLIQALFVLGLTEKAILASLSWHGFSPKFVPEQTFMCTLL